MPTILYATLLAGQYTTPAVYCEVTAVFTNTAPVDAYRGAGRPEATYVVERIVETAARDMGTRPGRDSPPQLHHHLPVRHAGPDIRHWRLSRLSGKGDQTADYAGFPARQAEAKARGKLRGIGFSSYIEACGLAPSNVAGALGARAGLFEAGEVRVHPTAR